MNRDVLLDAIGMVDDRFLSEDKLPLKRHGRKLTVLLAAVVALLAMTVTAMAVSEDFRETVFSLFKIQTQEVPPLTVPPDAGGAVQPLVGTDPSNPKLRDMGIVQIDETVSAFYFSGDGFIYAMEGGFYTSAHTQNGIAPETFSFWEITPEGIVETDGYRVEFPFTHGGKTFPIVFDYAILNGKLSRMLWVQNLDQGPYENSWNVTPIGNRTDIALMEIPVCTELDITNDYFLLDLQTQKATPLLTASEWEDAVVDICWFTEDLHYAIAAGFVPSAHDICFWLVDLQSDTVVTFEKLLGSRVHSTPYFLDNETVICWEVTDLEHFNVVRYHISTGIRQVLIENVTWDTYRSVQHSGWRSVYGLLTHEDGNYELVDLRTNERLALSGLDMGTMQTSESADGSRVWFGFREANKYTALGMLNPETGVMKLLNRSPRQIENFWGWLDENTVVLMYHNPKGDCYVYVYRFE